MSFSFSTSARVLGALLFSALLFAGCDALQEAEPAPAEATLTDVHEALAEHAALGRGRVVVANRASGTISVLGAASGNVIATLPLPQAMGEPLPEPMYVVYSAATDRVFVGDRANDRVVAFDARDGTVEGTAPATGIFHMWAALDGEQLWVVDNVNNALTVIDTDLLTVTTTVPVTGGVPHDVIVDPAETFAFATVFVDGAADQVVKYSTSTFTEVDRTDVGEDPHVGLTRSGDALYVPCQGTDEVVVLARSTLDEVTSIPVPGAHGAWIRYDDAVFYTTSFTSDGIDGLFAIDTSTNTVIGSTDTRPGEPVPTPHNVAATPSGRRIFVTHSGATATQVTVYTVSGGVTDSRTVTVGTNPFGIGYVPPVVP